jgi:hypothetical protein
VAVVHSVEVAVSVGNGVAVGVVVGVALASAVWVPVLNPPFSAVKVTVGAGALLSCGVGPTLVTTGVTVGDEGVITSP